MDTINWFSNHSTSIIDNLALVNLIKNKQIVTPFIPELLSYNGLDIRLSDEYCSLQKTDRIFDTRKDNPTDVFFYKAKTDNILISPNSIILLASIEQLRLPDYVTAFVSLRSSYARLGLQMPLGFIEPGFTGRVVFQISGGCFPIMVHAGDALYFILYSRN